MHCRTIVCLLIAWNCFAQFAPASAFTPDPPTVQRQGPAYRYPQAGWIVLHIEGDPYDRGQQHGKLLWREIENYIKCYAVIQSPKSPSEAWKLMRTMTDALFLRRFDPELLEEMKGIADGAAAAGAKFDGRPVDLTDIVAINIWPELLTLDEALRAQPTGLEGKNFDKQIPRPPVTPKPSRCSAFAATGVATKDGKAIIGHISMFEIYPCNFFNVWIDVKPTKGHRLVIQGAPGSIQSGMDWYINDAGIVLTETTISQTKFDASGLSTGSRSRHAMQYGDSIDSVVKLLGVEGNGLYTNEWLLADMKTNEIALFELGTKTSRLMRSSKDEWFGNTKGFYWGCNNTKDLAVRMETIAAANDRPANMIFCPEERDIAWVKLYERTKGAIDADFGKLAFGKPPLAARNSCDAKYTTADMALHLQSFAHWGDPYGQLWEPTHDEREKYREVQPIVPNDWTVLTTNPPAQEADTATIAVDLKTDASDKDEESDGDAHDDDNKPQPPPAWHGTILPASDGDIWLATAFAGFHNYVAHERELLKKHEKDKEKDKTKNKDNPIELTQLERDDLALRLFHARSAALTKGAAMQSVPLRKITSDPTDDRWFHSAAGRGIMLLAELRRRLGPDKFDLAMDAFGRDHAGKPTDTDSFIATMNAIDHNTLKDFFTPWLDSTDALPTLELRDVTSAHQDADYIVTAQVLSKGGCPPANIDVTLETEDGETTTAFTFNSGIAKIEIKTDKKPTRLIVNKYGQTPCTNGYIWSNSAFKRDLEHTLIIYGTRTEATANRIAAEKLQQGIIDQWQHAIVQIKPDTSITDDDLRAHHLLLVGRPECSDLIARLAKSLPVSFGPRSFIARGQTYAHADTAVIAAAANPHDDRFSIVCIAGLSPLSTLRAAQSLPQSAPAPLKLLPANHKPRDLVPPSPDLTRDLK